MNERDLTRSVFGEPPQDPAAEARARATLLAYIDRTARSKSRRRRWAVASLAAAIVVTVIASIAVVSLGPTTPAAARELERLLEVARGSTKLAPGPGEFVFMQADELRPETITILDGASFTVLSRLSVETWIAADGSGVRRTTVLDVSFASVEDERHWVDAGSPMLPRPGDIRTERYTVEDAPWIDTRAFSTEPDTVLEQLRAGSVVAHAAGDVEVFAVIGDVLAQGDAAPDVRAAMLQAAALLSGVTYLGDVVDPLGRDGIGFRSESRDHSVTLTFDPETAHLLSSETVRRFGTDSMPSWRAFHPARIRTDVSTGV